MKQKRRKLWKQILCGLLILAMVMTFMPLSSITVQAQNEAAGIVLQEDVILIPNETYMFTPYVTGVDESSLIWEVLDCTDPFTTIRNGVLTIGGNEQAEVFGVHVKSAECADNGKPVAEALARVYVRRVNSISGMLIQPENCQYKAGDEFIIDMDSIVVSNAENTHLETEYFNYKDPGMIEISCGSSTAGNMDFILTNNCFSMDSTNTRAIFTLTADMEYGESYTITARALHPAGENKTNSYGTSVTYAPVTTAFTIYCDREEGSGYWTIPYGGWKRIADQQQGKMDEKLYQQVMEECSNSNGVPARAIFEYRYKPYGLDDSYYTPWIAIDNKAYVTEATFNMHPNVTGLMDYDKRYVMEHRVSFWDPQFKEQYWPIEDVVPRGQYMVESTMEKVSVSYFSKALGIDFHEPDENGLRSKGGVTGSGREEAEEHTISLKDLNDARLLQFVPASSEDEYSGVISPKEVTEWFPEHTTYFVLPNKVEGIPSSRIVNAMRFIIEKKTDEGWKVCERGVDFRDIISDQGSCRVTGNNNTTPGLYRIKIWAEDMDYSILYNDPSEGLAAKRSLTAKEASDGVVDASNSTFTYNGAVYPCKVGEDGSVTFRRDYILYDENTGEGIYYFTIVDGSNNPPAHTHTWGVKRNGQAATCTVAGFKDYYQCSCGTFFEDASCDVKIGNEAALKSWKLAAGKIPALGHEKGTHHDRIEATPTEKGNVEYWDCAHKGCSEKLDVENNVLTKIEFGYADNWMLPENGWLRLADGQQGAISSDLYLSKKAELMDELHHDMFVWHEFRYKEAGADDSDFSPWILSENYKVNSSETFNMRPNVTGLMDYDKDYTIEHRVTFVDATTNERFWPIAATIKNEYQMDTYMKKVSVPYFSRVLGIDFHKPDANGVCSDGGVTGVGMEEADRHSVELADLDGLSLLQFVHPSLDEEPNGTNTPVRITEFWPERLDYKGMPNKVEGIPAENISNQMRFILEKKTEDGWVVCREGVDFAHIQNEAGSCKVTKNNNTTTGLYRIKLAASDMPYSILFMDPTEGPVPKSSLTAAEAVVSGIVNAAKGTFTYNGVDYPCEVDARSGIVSFKKDYVLYNEEDGTGIYYFTIVDSSHIHANGVKKSGQAATCTAEGIKDYYKCACGKYFEDAACTVEIGDEAALESWKLSAGIAPATGHKWEYTVKSTTITAKCAKMDVCKAEEKTLKITASNKVYDGTVYKATVVDRITGAIEGATVAVKYYKVDAEGKKISGTEGDYKAVGQYVAEATVTVDGVIVATVTDRFSISPKGTVITGLSNTVDGIKLTWAAVTDVDGYELYRKTPGGGFKKIASVVGERTKTFIDTTVDSGATYIYTVRTIKNGLRGAYEESAAKLYLEQPQVKVANAANGVKISWSVAKGATTYRIYRRPVGATSWTKLAVVDGTEVGFVDAKAVSGTAYNYSVRAYNGEEYGAYVQDVLIFYLAQPSVKVANVDTGVKVTWDTVQGATSYRVYRKKVGTTTWSKLTDAEGNVTSYVDTKAVSGTEYCYTVKAYQGDRTSAFVQDLKMMYLAQPVVSCRTVSTGVRVNWKQIEGASGYRIYRKAKGTSSWVLIKEVKDGTVTGYTDGKAEAGITYYYTVKAYNGSYVSSFDKNYSYTK